MSKMKTHSGAKKRFRTTANGKVKAKPANLRHMMMKKPDDMKRQSKRMYILNESDARIVLDNFLPYARGKAMKARRAIKKTYIGKAGA